MKNYNLDWVQYNVEINTILLFYIILKLLNESLTLLPLMQYHYFSILFIW